MVRCGCDVTNQTTCEEIVQGCVAQRLGLGLRNEDGRINVFASGDAGNVFEVRPGGVYSPATSQVWPDPTWTIDTLPDTMYWGEAGGIYRAPRGHINSFNDAVDNDFPIWEGFSFASSDNQAMWGWTGARVRFDTRTDNPSGILSRNITGLMRHFVLSDAGTRVNATGENTGAPEQYLTPYGGYLGFGITEYEIMAFRQVLDTAFPLKAVFVSTAHPMAITQTRDTIEALVQDIVDREAQAWTLLYIPGYIWDSNQNLIVAPVEELAAPVTAAGINLGVNLLSESEDPAPPETLAVSRITGIGATWVKARGVNTRPIATPQARLEELVAAGLNVAAAIRGRHYEVTANKAIGITRFGCDDPLYARGAEGGDNLYYRNPWMSGMTARTWWTGDLTSRDGVGLSESRRGFALSEERGRFYNRVFWAGLDGTNARIGTNSLLGELCPIPNATDYSLRLSFTPYFESLPSAPALLNGGVIFGKTDDSDPSPDSGFSSLPWDGYVFRLQYAGSGSVNMILERFDAGARTTLGTQAMGSYNLKAWNDATIVVSPTGISIDAFNGVTGFNITSSDTTHRGEYVHITAFAENFTNLNSSHIIGIAPHGANVPVYQG